MVSLAAALSDLAPYMPLRHGVGFPPTARSRVGEYLRSELATGVQFPELATRLGISKGSARRWAMLPSPPSEPKLVRVEVAATEAFAPPPRLVLTTPRGLRLEGASVEQIVAIMAQLG